MSVRARLLAVCCAVALLSACVAVSAGAAGPSGTDATASAKPKKGSKGAKKGCKKGYKKVTVTKKGKQVKVCRKVKKAAGGGQGGSGGGPAGLFEAPGKQLNGEETKPFLTKYLLNSTFTDCVTGWPSCGGFENRYSHSADNTFYQCWLRPTSGSDVKSVGEYGVANARVEPDGSWYVQEVVSWYGGLTSFEWHVTAAGVVEGASKSHQTGETEKIGPLQYVGGVAKNCSY